MGELDRLIEDFLIDEIIITANLRKNAKRKLLNVARSKKIKVSLWFTDELVLFPTEKDAIQSPVKSQEKSFETKL